MSGLTIRTVMLEAFDLLSEHGENPEYDRAIIELTERLIGAWRNDPATRIADVINEWSVENLGEPIAKVKPKFPSMSYNDWEAKHGQAAEPSRMRFDEREMDPAMTRWYDLKDGYGGDTFIAHTHVAGKVGCDTCNADRNVRCMTGSGHLAKRPHAARLRRFYDHERGAS